MGGGLLCMHLDSVPVTRTQEARVLEVAREMLGGGWQGWMIPHAGGRERLHKPPLAYWLSAAAFKVFGVGEGAGRLPMALAGWLTIGVTFWCAAWLFDRRTAFFAAASLFSCFLFFRFSRLAETDPLSLLLTTAATFFLWRGAGLADQAKREGSDFRIQGSTAPLLNPEPQTPNPSIALSFLWYHGAAALIGLAAIAKGPPALFPVLFFLAYTLMSGRWGLLGRLVLSGAPITFLLVAAPWWLYILHERGYDRILRELSDVSEGRDHPGWFTKYFWYLAYGAMPWTLFAAAGLVEAIRRWRGDLRLRGVLLWLGTILLPLCLIGNKQPHYALPMLPPLMILVGWLIGRCFAPESDEKFLKSMRWMLLATMLATLLVPVAVVVVPKIELHRIRASDWVLAGLTLAAAGGALAVYRLAGWRRGLVALALSQGLIIGLLIAFWEPGRENEEQRQLAAALRQAIGDRPACFYGPATNLEICFQLRRVIPTIGDEPSLRQHLAEQPRTVVIVPAMHKPEFPRPPSWLAEQQSLRSGAEVIGLFKAERE